MPLDQKDIKNYRVKNVLSDLERVADYLDFSTECGCYMLFAILSVEFQAAKDELDTIRVDGAWTDEQSRLDLLDLLRRGKEMTEDTRFTFITRKVIRIIAALEAEHALAAVDVDESAAVTAEAIAA